MDKPMSDTSFKFMSLAFKFRDLLQDPADILLQAGVKPGHRVLDYGCVDSRCQAGDRLRQGICGGYTPDGYKAGEKYSLAEKAIQ